MSKPLRVVSVNFPFENQQVVQEKSLATDRAFFDFDVVVIRPQLFQQTQPKYSTYEWYESLMNNMNKKKAELERLFAQGGLLIVLLDEPSTLTVSTGSYTASRTYSVSNYEFLAYDFAHCLQSGVGEQINYSDHSEPFAAVLKKSSVAWTAYVAGTPARPFDELRFFASAGAGTAVAGKMAFSEGHLIVLPNLKRLDEPSFLEACAEYRYKRQGTQPPDWVPNVSLPGLSLIETELGDIEKRISTLQTQKESLHEKIEELSAFRKLLYEKGKAHLEPAVRRAFDLIGFETKPAEIISGTNYEIDGRTTVGSVPGIVEVKGSKNLIGLDEFSPFVVKIVADHQTSRVVSKGILVGNGLCEQTPDNRVGSAVFSQHVLDGANRNSVSLINSVELYWLCCALLAGGAVDKNASREAILSANGYVDLKAFCGKTPW